MSQMNLTAEEQALRAGEYGPAAQWAIEHQIKVGEYLGAADFVAVSSAHVMADTESLGLAGVEWVERLATQAAGQRCLRVPTITDPRGTDFAAAHRLKQQDWMVELEGRAIVAFEKLGVQNVVCPGMYHHQMNLDLCVDIGGYESPKNPDEPILVRMERTPCLPGLPERDQHRAGRGDLLSTPFETFERNIRDQFARVLGGAGFDPAQDITAITVNRWPHGYAYEYNFLFDPEWPQGESPCEIGRKRFGRIAIANSDAGAAAYTDQAMDQAWRAVEELHSA